MTGEIKREIGNALLKQSTQGVITLALVLTLCYCVIADPAAYKDLFGYALSTGLGFYFGRETKAES